MAFVEYLFCQKQCLVSKLDSLGHVGKLHFNDSTNGCSFDEPLPIEGSLGLYTAAIHEQDSASVAGKLTEGGVEVESERLPSTLMQLSDGKSNPK